MKKVFTLILGVAMSVAAMSQSLPSGYKINTNNNQDNPILIQAPSHLKTASYLAPGDQHSEWVNFGYALCDVTVGSASTNYKVNSGILFPDTFAIIRYWDNTAGNFVYRNVNWCSVGSIFDPTSAVLRQIWGNEKIVKPYAAYTLDSISIPYWYDRYDTNVVDTLVVQFYKPANISPYSYTSGTNAGKRAFAVTKYSRSKKEGAMADYVVRIPLKQADTAMNHLGYIRQAVPGFNITAGGPVAVTWTFKPGKTFSYLDTIPLAKWDSVQGVKRPLNSFLWLYYSDQTQTELFEYNNGENINTQQRYNDLIFTGQSSTIFPSTYLPFAIWTYPVYPWISMKISWTETLGINHNSNDVNVQLYPNPANSSDNMNLDVKLNSSKIISIDIYDILGHKVASVANGTYNSGIHTFPISTAELSSGMYICNIIADGALKTIKFEVR